MRSETQLQTEILDALHRIGVWAWRVNAGVRGGVRMAPAGTPDICVVNPPGWLEVKRPGEKLRAEQRAWHEKARRRGVRVATVTSRQQAVTLVKAWACPEGEGGR